MVKKILMLFFLFLFLSLSLFGANKQVTITISNWLAAEKATEEIFKKMIDDFMVKNPTIKVVPITLPFSNYKDQVLINSIGGNPSDVIMGNSQMMIAFSDADILEPLDKVIKKEVISDVYPNNLKGTTFNGSVKALSWAPHPIALFYNKELFKKAGLNPNNSPKTWAEMIDYAKKIAALGKDEKGNKIYGISLECGKASKSGSDFMGIIYSYGGEFVRDGKVVLDSPETIEALQLFRDLVKTGVMPAAVEMKDIRALFSSGKVGMIFDGDFGRSFFRSMSGKGTEFDKMMGVALIPVNKTGRSETIYTEHELGIAKNSKNKEAAAKLVEYLISKDAMVMYHKAIATMSARKSIARLPEMNEDTYMKLFNKQAETARALPVTNVRYDNAMIEITTALERATLTKDDLKKIVKETQEKIEGLYKK